MTCPSCEFDNDPHADACRACGAQFAAYSGAVARRGATNGSSVPASFEARIADAEARLAALSEHIRAAENERVAIAQTLALARRVASGLALQTSDSRPLPARLNAPPPALDVGSFRVRFGAASGTRLEWTGVAASVTPPYRVAVTRWALPAVDVRPAAANSVWQWLASGAQAVRIDSPCGGGATTLLSILGAGAQDHGFSGAIVVSDVRGSALDIAQRIAARLYDGTEQRYQTAADLRRLGAAPVLVLLDRAQLTADEQAGLTALFPAFRFIVSDSLGVPQTPTVELVPCDAQSALTLVEAGYGRSIEGAEQTAALALCAGSDLQPGSARMFGIAAQRLGRSFVGLRYEFAGGGEVIAAWIASLSQIEKTILAALALTRAPLTSELLSRVTGYADVRAPLADLRAGELVRAVGPDTYELPSALEPLAPAMPDADAALGRFSDALCDMLELVPSTAFGDGQLAAAEPLVGRAFERSQWNRVLALGPRLADVFAQRGAFGAWGRVLNLIAAAAKRVEETAPLSLARHEIGVRALLVGEYHKATSSLRTAARERERNGDATGAAASSEMLVLVDKALAATDRVLDPQPDRTVRFTPIAVEAAPPALPAASERAPSGSNGSNGHAFSAAATVQHSTAPPDASTLGATAATGATNGAEDASAVPDASAAFASDSSADDATGSAPAVQAQNGAAHSVAGAADALPSKPQRPYFREPSVVPPKGGPRLNAGALAVLGTGSAALAFAAVFLFVHPKAGPAIAEFTASAATGGGTTTRLCVRATDAALVEVRPDVGPLPADGKQCVDVHPAITTTYTAVVTGNNGQTVQQPITVGVREAPAPRALKIEAFSAQPARIRVGQSTKLCYSVSGANLLRIVPSVGNLVRLQSCTALTLNEPHRFTYKLLAVGDSGQVAVSQTRIDVAALPSPSPSPAQSPSPAAGASPATAASLAVVQAAAVGREPHVAPTPGGWLARKAVYQFDVTPALVMRGQAASLCVGIGHWARGNVSGIGPLEPGINRCYRVAPTATTVYRLHVSLDASVAEETVTVAVAPPARHPDVAKTQHH